jgi:hypothetical protein
VRTTLDLDDRVLAIARARAKARGVSLGRAVSDLALDGASGARENTGGELVRSAVSGFPILRGVKGHVITDEMVADALDDD